MENQNFQITGLTNLSYKNDQLRSRQQVQDDAVFEYKHLKYEANLVKK